MLLWPDYNELCYIHENFQAGSTIVFQASTSKCRRSSEPCKKRGILIPQLTGKSEMWGQLIYESRMRTKIRCNHWE